jgi:hypothetical protein
LLPAAADDADQHRQQQLVYVSEQVGCVTHSCAMSSACCPQKGSSSSSSSGSGSWCMLVSR